MRISVLNKVTEKPHISWKLLVFLFTVYFIPMLIMDLFIINRNDYYSFFLGKGVNDQIETIVNISISWRPTAYLITAINLFVKTIIVSSILWIGIFLSGKKLAFNKIWLITIATQLLFAMKGYILLMRFIIGNNLNLELLQNFHPFSLANLFSKGHLEPYLLFLFQSLSLFEITYWLILAYFLAKLLTITFNEGLNLILSYYVPAYCLWLLTISFLIVSNP